MPMLNARPLLPFVAFTALLSCTGPAPTTEAVPPTVPPKTVFIDDAGDTAKPVAPQEDRTTVPFDENGPRYTWSIIPANNGTFGFAIYDRGKLYIDQQKATGLGGPDGWKTKTDARAVALTTLEKLEKGEVPEGLNIVGQ
jgi:cytolysin (calcineurin-like family phosphatase)